MNVNSVMILWNSIKPILIDIVSYLVDNHTLEAINIKKIAFSILSNNFSTENIIELLPIASKIFENNEDSYGICLTEEYTSSLKDLKSKAMKFFWKVSGHYISSDECDYNQYSIVQELNTVYLKPLLDISCQYILSGRF